jgi:hypothetical protein
MKALDFETEPPQKVASAWLGKNWRPADAVRRMLEANRLYVS